MGYLFQSTAVCALVAASFSIFGSAGAQTVSAATKGEVSEPLSSSEIVVTATKRQENLRDIPATITAVTSAQLAATGPVAGTGDLLRTVPGVRFNDLQAPNLSEISIRGSGTERATGADSAVGLFVNGAYAGSSTLGGRNFKNIDFFDLDRIEVLEGPQSALYGRNAEFGVVNVVLAKPKFNTSGYVDESYTDKLDQNRLTAVGNYALNDEWAVRLGVETIGQTKGFYKNPDDNQYYDHTSGWIGRGQIRYEHGPLDVTWLVDAQDLKLPVFVSGLEIAPGKVATVPLGYTSDRFSVPSEGINSTEQRVQRSQLLADLDLGWAKLTSTSMITHSSSLQYYGAAIDLGIEGQFQKLGEVGVWPLSQVHTAAKDQTYYQDLHLAGTTLNSALDWLAGVEVLHQHDSNLVAVATTPCALTATSSICGGTPTAPVCYQLQPTDKACPTAFPLSFGTVSFTPQSYNSQAAYGSLRYKVGRFTLSGEARYTNDLKKATQFSTALYTNLQTAAPRSFKFSAGNTSWGLTASYKLPTPWDDMLYTKVGTGYRAGGVNLSSTPNPAAPVAFQPTYNNESTTSYEAGFKGKLGSHLYVTLDGYISQTNDAIAVTTDGCAITNACGQAAHIFNINGGTVHGHGVELAIDGRFQVAGGRLIVDVNGSNQHARFVSVNGVGAGLPIVGSKVAQIPDWNSSASLDYLHPIATDLDGFFHITYSGQNGGGQDTVTPTAPFVGLSSITDLSLRTGVHYKKLEAAFFVQNLTDATIKLLTLQSAGVTNAVRYNQPRTMGVNLIYRW